MKTADPELMRAINRFHVMDAIRRLGPIARVEISDVTELSATTVSAITAALLDDGLIVTRQEGAIRDTGRGRPRVMLELNPGAAHVVGVKLSPHQITVAVTNFRADLLAALSLPIRLDRQPDHVIFDLVEDGIRRCILDAGLAVEAISGICIGLPGVVERAAGICRQSMVFRDSNVPVAARMQQRFPKASVTIDSDVNLVTLAEHWFGDARGLDSFLVVSVEHSLGLGILHNGELFRGANGLSPDLGDFHVRSPLASHAARLDAIASEASIVSEARMLLAGTAHEAAFRIDRGMAKVLELARNGDEAILLLLSGVGEALGFAIANLITLFAPPKVILVGAAMEAQRALMGPVQRTIAMLVPASLADVAEIVVHHWNDEMWARGGAAMALRDLYGAPWNTTGPAVRTASLENRRRSLSILTLGEQDA